MKRIILLSLVICSFALTACQQDAPLTGTANIGELGAISGQFGEQLEKKTVRMFNVDGDLYYDSGLVNDTGAKCGTMDGELKKTVAETEIPLKSGEANFEIEGYQNATSITKEVNIDGEWVIFRKYDLYDDTLDGLKYCHYIKGHLKNAVIDTEMIVLSDYADVTFNDIHDSLLSSKYPAETTKGATHFNYITSDKWGITLHADDVTPKGMTLKIEQFGGEPTGELQTGDWYKLEKNVNDEWQYVNPKIDNPAWHSVAYGIKKNDITELGVDWEFLYGELSPGHYSLSKEIMDIRAAGDYDKNLYTVYFTVE